MCLFDEKYSKEDFARFEKELAESKLRFGGATGSFVIENQHGAHLKYGYRNDFMKWWWPGYIVKTGATTEK